jgi:hypothetical protein
MCAKCSISSHLTVNECKKYKNKGPGKKSFMKHVEHEVPNIKMLSNEKLPG